MTFLSPCCADATLMSSQLRWAVNYITVEEMNSHHQSSPLVVIMADPHIPGHYLEVNHSHGNPWYHYLEVNYVDHYLEVKNNPGHYLEVKHLLGNPWYHYLEVNHVDGHYPKVNMIPCTIIELVPNCVKETNQQRLKHQLDAMQFDSSCAIVMIKIF